MSLMSNKIKTRHNHRNLKKKEIIKVSESLLFSGVKPASESVYFSLDARSDFLFFGGIAMDSWPSRSYSFPWRQEVSSKEILGGYIICDLIH